jgi:hypothetical protein
VVRPDDVLDPASVVAAEALQRYETGASAQMSVEGLHRPPLLIVIDAGMEGQHHELVDVTCLFTPSADDNSLATAKLAPQKARRALFAFPPFERCCRFPDVDHPTKFRTALAFVNPSNFGCRRLASSAWT